MTLGAPTPIRPCTIGFWALYIRDQEKLCERGDMVPKNYQSVSVKNVVTTMERKVVFKTWSQPPKYVPL